MTTIEHGHWRFLADVFVKRGCAAWLQWTSGDEPMVTDGTPIALSTMIRIAGRQVFVFYEEERGFEAYGPSFELTGEERSDFMLMREFFESEVSIALGEEPSGPVMPISGHA